MDARTIGRRGSLVCTSLLVLGVTTSAFAQAPTLGDIARKEQERRKGATAPTKVLTNDDLKDGGLPSGPPPTASAAAGEGAKSAPPAAQAET
jgi:hypothetical protein